VNERLWDEVLGLILKPERLDELVNVPAADMSTSRELNRIETQVSAIERKLERLLTLYEDGDIEKITYIRRRDQHQEQLRQLTVLIESAKQQLALLLIRRRGCFGASSKKPVCGMTASTSNSIQSQSKMSSTNTGKLRTSNGVIGISRWPVQSPIAGDVRAVKVCELSILPRPVCLHVRATVTGRLRIRCSH